MARTIFLPSFFSPPCSRSIRPFLLVLAWAAFRRCTSRNYGELSTAGRRRFVELSKTWEVNTCPAATHSEKSWWVKATQKKEEGKKREREKKRNVDPRHRKWEDFLSRSPRRGFHGFHRGGWYLVAILYGVFLFFYFKGRLYRRFYGIIIR